MDSRIVLTDLKVFAKSHLSSIAYVALPGILLTFVMTIQSHRHAIIGTGLLLGWDSPGYVWVAQDLIRNGPLLMMNLWSFPQLYVQLLAFLGYLVGDVVLIERVLPILFGILLIYANFEVALKVAKNVHVAGLAALLTFLSLNVLRLLADLHRNLMAFSLVMMSFLLVPNLQNRGSFFNRKYLLFVVLLFIIAGTHFETFFVLSLSLVLYGCLTKDWRNLVMLILACAIPAAILVLLFPVYFFGYATSVFSLGHVFALDDFVLWTGGSFILSGFFIIAVFFLFRRLVQRNDRLALLVFSHSLVIILLVFSVVLTRALPVEFALRVLLLLPIPVLSALTLQALADSFNTVFIHVKVFSRNRQHLSKVSVRRLLLCIVVLILVANSTIVSLQHIDVFLIPYIPPSSYERLLTASEFLRNNGLSQPVVVYYGSPAIWFTGLYRNYLGAELGEHFSYYGSIENLLRLIPSELKFKDDPVLAETERRISTLYYNELVGNWSGLIPTTYSHQSYITSAEALMSHPLLVITPELYDDMIPYYLMPFHNGEGIYIVPPGSLKAVGETVYGPSIVIRKNGAVEQTRSELLYIDPYDASRIILRVNASLGYSAYVFSDYPSSWTFLRLEQGDALSFPENDPQRLDAVRAVEGNDPADSVDNWSTPQNGILGIDSSSKREGLASVKVIGITDFWGSLGVQYNLSGVQDLNRCPTLAVWAKANEEATFSMTLHDSAGNTRTYWNIQTYGSSATVQWKRFVVDLSNYTSQTPNFDLGLVDFIDLYVSSSSDKQMSLWVDDLVIDDFPQLETTIYKARVLASDVVIAYFTSKEGTG